MAGIIIVIKIIGVRIGLDLNMRPEMPCHVYVSYLFSSYKELQLCRPALLYPVSSKIYEKACCGFFFQLRELI